MNRFPYFRWYLAVLSSGLQLLPFPLAGPVPLWRREFCWVCLVPLLMALLRPGREETPLTVKASALLGYGCGVLWYLGNCYWIYQTMYLYGGIAKPASVGILLLFSLYLGLYFALFGGVLGWLREHLGARWALVLSPFVWVAVELARARITSFPWDLLGYSLVDNALLTRLAPVTGVLGLTLLVAAVNVCVAWPLVVPRNSKSLLAESGTWFALPVLLVALVTGAIATPLRLYPAGALPAKALLLQENLGVGAEAKGPAESKLQLLNDFTRRTLAAEQPGTKVVLWPESPAPFQGADPEFRKALSELAVAAKAPVVVDNVGVDPDPQVAQGYDLFNSASVFSADGSYLGRYDKMHLVPFGEYVPYKQVFFFAGSLLDEVGRFTAGRYRRTFDLEGESYGIFICYESIFGEEIRHFVKEGHASVLVNLSDDGWYGDTSAPWQHLDMVKMRAIENHRWVLRATNTGVTAAINPEGRIEEQAPRHQRLTLPVRFAFEHDLTIYTQYGDWVGWACVAVVLGGFAVGWPSARKRLHAKGTKTRHRPTAR